MKFKALQLLTCLSFCLLLSFSVTRGQVVTVTQAPATPAATPGATPAATAPAPVMAPDQKAYDEARRVKDPRKRIEALEKVITDFPDRFGAFQARNDVLDILIKNFPNEKDQIRAAAEKILQPNPGIVVVGASSYVTVATKLMDAGMFLDWAEELAKKGSVQYEDEQAKAMKRQRARYQDALGRIYLKQGKAKLARTFLKQAIANDPDLTTSFLALGQIAEQGGDHKAAVEYFSSAAVKAPMKKADRQLMESAYRQTHHDTLAGLEDLLDDKYRKLNASGLRLDHYQAPKSRTKRTALAELFTGSGCGPCIAADLGFDAMLGRYSRQELVVLVYHLHVPLPDPMTNPITEARGKYYGVPGTPTPVLDGLRLPASGGGRDMTKGFYDRVNPKIEMELESPAEADLKLTGTVEGDLVKARVTVDAIKASSPDLKLQLALTEDELRYTGENGIRFHPMVVRSLGGKDALGFSLAKSGPTDVEWTFDLKAMSEQLKQYLETYEQKGHRGGDPFKFNEKKFEIDANNLSLVAFVQDTRTKVVLQTVYLKIKPAVTASAQTAQK
jgi:tetratricopeptide (TPR) repeat protein